MQSVILVIFVLIMKLIDSKMRYTVLMMAFLFAGWHVPLLAQEKEKESFSDNNPQKYNPSFAGIGPQVYILPPPKTEAELLIEKYILKKQNQGQIDSLLVNLNLEKALKRINSIPPPSYFIDSLKNKTEEAQLIAAIDYYKNEDNENYSANWQNNLAVFYLISGEWNKADSLFLESLRIKERSGSLEDQALVLNNLALLEASNGNSAKALSLYSQLLERAKKTKDLNNQALSYIAMAKLEARGGNFFEAHNLIIKKSVPLLQRSKNHEGIVIALNTLASFKELQEADTEAKWIYLQAVDVAYQHRDEMGLAISYFNLAQLKSRIGDGYLSIADYMVSKELAIKNNMENLLMEVQDGLGDAYLKLNDYKAAALALNEYQSLKSNLLNQYLSPQKISRNKVSEVF